MRFDFTAKGEPCQVEVRFAGDAVFATILSTAPNKATLYKYRADVDVTRAYPDMDVFLKEVAQDAVDDYVAGVPEQE